MASDKRTLGFKAGPELAQEVQAYKERNNHDTTSDAVREVTRIGLRESKSPILYRAKDQVLEWAAYLSLAALVTTILGLITTLFTPSRGLQIAFVMLGIALSLVAVVELARLLNGQSELADIIKSQL